MWFGCFFHRASGKAAQVESGSVFPAKVGTPDHCGRALASDYTWANLNYNNYTTGSGDQQYQR